MLFDFVTHTWSRLTQKSGLLRWSADSHWVYYLRYGDNPAIMRVRISDRYVEQVASLNGIRLTGMLAGLEFGLTPPGNPLTLMTLESIDWNSHKPPTQGCRADTLESR
jgi:hypothetical protein